MKNEHFHNSHCFLPPRKMYMEPVFVVFETRTFHVVILIRNSRPVIRQYNNTTLEQNRTKKFKQYICA